jgi:hypothetical protein
MCDSANIVNPARATIEEMPNVNVLTLVNRVLGPKSQVPGQDRLAMPLSSKPGDERDMVWYYLCL